MQTHLNQSFHRRSFDSRKWSRTLDICSHTTTAPGSRLFGIPTNPPVCCFAVNSISSNTTDFVRCLWIRSSAHLVQHPPHSRGRLEQFSVTTGLGRGLKLKIRSQDKAPHRLGHCAYCGEGNRTRSAPCSVEARLITIGMMARHVVSLVCQVIINSWRQ
jgi:hypothetical protein